MKIAKKLLSLVRCVAMMSSFAVASVSAATVADGDTTMDVVYDAAASTNDTVVLKVVGELDDTLSTTGYSFTIACKALKDGGYVDAAADFSCVKNGPQAGAANYVNGNFIANCSVSSLEAFTASDSFTDGVIATITISLDKQIEAPVSVALSAAKVSYYDWDSTKTMSYSPTKGAGATIPAATPSTTPATIALTASEGAVANSMYYKAVVTPGTAEGDKITAANIDMDVTLADDTVKERIVELGAETIADIDGAFTFYIGNTWGDAKPAFTATANATAAVTGAIASKAVAY